MSSEWRSVKFAELIREGTLQIGDGYRAKNDELGGAGLIFLRSAHVKNSHIDFAGVEYFLDEDPERFKAKVAKAGDVVITTKGNGTGRVAFVTREMPSFVYSPHLSFWRSLAPDRLVPGFLRAWSSSQEFQTQLRGMCYSTDMAPYLSLTDQRELRISLPPMEEQLAIAAILDALETRLTLLRETNATLEAIDQALFKSWFVDFDPVHAKQAGRDPESMDAATAALFPDGFEESELGPVPKGWRVSAIGDVVDYVGGGTPSTKETAYWEPGEHAWTTPKDLSGLQSPVLMQTERLISSKGLAKVSSGLLPAGSLLLSSRAPIGYLAIAQPPLAINQGYIAMLPSSLLPPLYMLFWCRQNMDVIKSRANGSTFMEISKKAFSPIPSLVPPAQIVDAFMDVAELLFKRLVENEKQAQALLGLRDNLLPRLISGQLRLPSAVEERVELLTGT